MTEASTRAERHSRVTDWRPTLGQLENAYIDLDKRRTLPAAGAQSANWGYVRPEKPTVAAVEQT